MPLTAPARWHTPKILLSDVLIGAMRLIEPLELLDSVNAQGLSAGLSCAAAHPSLINPGQHRAITKWRSHLLSGCQFEDPNDRHALQSPRSTGLIYPDMP